MLDDKKIAFITCVNSDWWYSECKLYLEHLIIPDGMTAEFFDVRDAESMTAGYNRAMKNSDAKYKIYLHQDTFIVNKNLVADLLKIFAEKSIGVVGVIGCVNLPATGVLTDEFCTRANRRVSLIHIATSLTAIIKSLNRLTDFFWRRSTICLGAKICLTVGICMTPRFAKR